MHHHINQQGSTVLSGYWPARRSRSGAAHSMVRGTVCNGTHVRCIRLVWLGTADDSTPGVALHEWPARRSHSANPQRALSRTQTAHQQVDTMHATDGTGHQQILNAHCHALRPLTSRWTQCTQRTAQAISKSSTRTVTHADRSPAGGPNARNGRHRLSVTRTQSAHQQVDTMHATDGTGQ
jgi:hypothetical protein